MDADDWGFWDSAVLESDRLLNPVPSKRRRCESSAGQEEAGDVGLGARGLASHIDEDDWMNPFAELDSVLFDDYTSDLYAQFTFPRPVEMGLEIYPPEFTDTILTLGDDEVHGPSVLAKQNPLPCDGLVVMQPLGHRYYWRTSRSESFRSGGTMGVTTLLKAIEEPFDAPFIAGCKAASNVRAANKAMLGTADRYHRGVLVGDELVRLEKQFGAFSPERVRASWDDANRLGTELHAQIEAYYEHGVVPVNPSPQFVQFLDFSKQPQYTRERAFRTELSMFYAPLGLVGQADMLFKGSVGPDGVQKYVLVDWKRVGKLNQPFTPTAEFKERFPHATCTKLGKYALQLQLYAFLAEQMGLPIESMVLCVFPPEGGRWEVYPVPPMPEERDWLLEQLRKAWRGRYRLG